MIFERSLTAFTKQLIESHFAGPFE